jgi:glycosyltransferase involved in cell wall biosynthesis
MIGTVVGQARRFADDVIVVDDGSTDRTADLAKRSGAVVVRHHCNLGKGNALRTGFVEALKMNPVIVVTLDADGQHLPYQIPLLARPIMNGDADVVVGTRMLQHNGMPISRILSNKISTILIGLITGLGSISLSDSQCGFRAFSARTAPIVLRTRSEGFNVEAETLILARIAGLRIREVPVACIYRAHAKSGIVDSREIRLFARLLLEFLPRRTWCSEGQQSM